MGSHLRVDEVHEWPIFRTHVRSNPSEDWAHRYEESGSPTQDKRKPAGNGVTVERLRSEVLRSRRFIYTQSHGEGLWLPCGGRNHPLFS